MTKWHVFTPSIHTSWFGNVKMTAGCWRSYPMLGWHLPCPSKFFPVRASAYRGAPPRKKPPTERCKIDKYLHAVERAGGEAVLLSLALSADA